MRCRRCQQYRCFHLFTSFSSVENVLTENLDAPPEAKVGKKEVVVEASPAMEGNAVTDVMVAAGRVACRLRDLFPFLMCSRANSAMGRDVTDRKQSTLSENSVRVTK